MPRWGNPLSVKMSNAGAFGWYSDKRGYRYETHHPDTGSPWGPIPADLLALWGEVAGFGAPPECCLINLYRGTARMGPHQDKDEQEFAAPVVSVSLGDSAVFRIGGLKRADPSETVTLESGDVCILGGPARLAFHGVDRILPGSSTLVPGGGRVNLTPAACHTRLTERISPVLLVRARTRKERRCR